MTYVVRLLWFPTLEIKTRTHDKAHAWNFVECVTVRNQRECNRTMDVNKYLMLRWLGNSANLMSSTAPVKAPPYLY